MIAPNDNRIVDDDRAGGRRDEIAPKQKAASRTWAALLGAMLQVLHAD